MTAMIRTPERWQVADTLSGDEALPRDARQQADESAAVWMNERNSGRDESSIQFPAVARDLTSLIVYSASQEGERRSAGVVRRATESFAAVLASRFGVVGREQSGLTRARWKRPQRPDVVGDMIRLASGFDTERLTVRATTDSMADKRPALRVAHALVAVELQTSRRGVNGPER